MPTMSISQLANITGLDRRTVTQRLEDIDHTGGEKPGQAISFDTTVALPALYLGGLEDEGNTKRLDVKLEKAKLDRARRHLAEVTLAEKKRVLIPADSVQTHWSAMVSNCRARLLAIPSRLALSLAGVTDPHEINDIARGLVYESLTELSGDGIPLPKSGNGGTSG